MNKRGEIDWVVLVILGILALAAFGGYSLYKHNVAAPDEKCFWMVRSSDLPLMVWVIDVPPSQDTGGCPHFDFLRKHEVSFGETKAAVEFANKAGRKICGQIVDQCPPPKQ